MAESHSSHGKDVSISIQDVDLAMQFVSRPMAVHLQNVDDCRIPLVIGACGHRDLRKQDVERLKHRVEAELVRLRTTYWNTPLIVLSALAEGADCLVAQVALELRDRYPENLKLVVPLPMRRDEYAQFNTNLESVRQFRRFLEAADYWFEMPLLEGNTAENVVRSEARRDTQYQSLGWYIAVHSHILIALWDGKETGRTGGTSEIVRFKRQGVSTRPRDTLLASCRLEPSDVGPVYQIVTPRFSDHDRADAFTAKRLYPVMMAPHRAEEHFHRIFENLNAFNGDVASRGRDRSVKSAESRHALLPPAIQRDLPVPLRAMLERYRAADALAIGRRRGTVWVQRFVHLLPWIGLIGIEAFAHVQPFQRFGLHLTDPWLMPVRGSMLSVAVLAFLGAGLIYVRKQPTLDTHLDYRALAEGLRVQLFWLVAGIQSSVADYFLAEHRTELDWIRSALRACCIPLAPSGPVCNADLVLDHWVIDQHGYFQRCRDDAILRWWNLLTEGLLIVAAGVAFGFIAHLAQSLIEAKSWIAATGVLAWAFLAAWMSLDFVRLLLGRRARHDTLKASLIAVSIVFAVLLYTAWTGARLEPESFHVLVVMFVTVPLISAGIIQHYCEKRAFHEHGKLYRRMEGLFGQARRALDGAGSGGEQRDIQQERLSILHELGRHALEENGDWVTLHRERPLEVPFG